jgi:broad specificity phosphatase PhoE
MAVVDPSVAEIPSPSDDVAERHAWLRQVMGGTWSDLGPRYTSWRNMVADLLLQFRDDTVVVSHFMAINAAIGRATDDDRLMCEAVGNASITILEHDGKVLTLAERGEHDPTSPVL